MNASNSPTTIQFQLKDGHATLAAWKQSIEKFPTIGETIALDETVRKNTPGYAESANVVQVDYDSKTSETTVTLEARPNDKKQERPVVFLNSNYIPESLHGAAEERVRNAFELPLVEWVGSYEAKPVTQVHGTAPDGLERLQNELRELVEATLEDVAFVKS
ncbi:MAG: hypothetical protein QM680_09350 [Luteolibacter sp.]